MAERENDRNDRSMDQVFDEAKTEDAWRQKMRADFRELTNYIASPEVTDTSVVQSKLFAQLGLYAEVGNDPTQWETGPVMLALVEKAQADLLGTEHERELSEWDKKIAVFSVDNTVLESVLRKQAEALRYGNGAIVAYTAEEAVQLAEYSELLGNRDTILKMSGAGGLCEMINQGWQLNTQRNELRVEIVNAELRVGTAMDEDRWDRYDELVEISKGALSVGEKERYDELVAEEIRLKRKGRELGYRDKKRIEKFEKRMDDQLEEEGVLDEFCEFLDDSAIVSAIEDRRWVEDAKKGLVRLDNEIMVQDAKTEKQLEGKESAKWYELYRAFRGAADLIETTHGWEKNWTDLEQGAIKGFVESRWTKSYRPSDMVALLNLPGLGEAIEASFGAMAAVATGAGVLGSDGKRYADASRLPKGTSQVAVTNIFLQKDGFTEKQLQEDFFDPIRGFAEKASGSGLYARFATEVARQLFETSLLSGFYGIKRNLEGNIVYKDEMGVESAEFDSLAYQWGVPAEQGGGSLYGQLLDDYIKVTGTRIKQMNEAAKAYPTGLPAIVTVLPDSLAKPFIDHEKMLAIAKGERNLASEYKEMSESNRWYWLMKTFRAAQVYNGFLSQFIVGLKGFRDITGEVDFFLSSMSNLAGLKKKVENASGMDSIESQRLIMNLVLALLYSVMSDYASPRPLDDRRSVLTSAVQGKDLPVLNFKKDDFARIFAKYGLLTNAQFEYLWDVRFYNVQPGEGGKAGVGMIKKGELGLDQTMREVRDGARSKTKEVRPEGIPRDLWLKKDGVNDWQKRRRKEYILSA